MDGPPALIDEDAAAKSIFRAPDTAHLLAADLRDLRYSAGNPTLRAMSTTTGLSKSVLSSAFTGNQLPTSHTLDLLVRSLGDDPDTWLQRRESLRERITRRSARPEENAPSAPSRTRPRPRRVSIVTLIAAMGIVAMMATAGATTIRHLSVGGDSEAQADTSTRQPLAVLAPGRGVDPLHTDCTSDAAVVSSAQRYGGSVLIELLTSSSCSAVWSRASWIGDAIPGSSLSIELYREGAKYGGRARTTASSSASKAHTTMLIIDEEGRSYCAVTIITMPNGSQTELSPPVCS